MKLKSEQSKCKLCGKEATFAIETDDERNDVKLELCVECLKRLLAKIK